MNPYLILTVVLAWGVSTGGAYFYGTGVGRDGEIAKQLAVKTAIEQTRKAAQEGAADAIARIKITNTTIRGKTETIVRENVVYRDCVHDANGFQLLNDALRPGRGTESARDSKLPGVNAVN